MNIKKLSKMLPCYFMLFLFGSILPTSCVKRNVFQTLTGEQYRYWHYIAGRISKGKEVESDTVLFGRIDSIFLFDDSLYYPWCRGEQFIVYFDKYNRYVQYNKIDGDFVECDIDNDWYTPSWKLLNDSMFIISRDTCKIISLSEKRILLYRKTRIDTMEAVDYKDVPKSARRYRKPLEHQSNKPFFL